LHRPVACKENDPFNENGNVPLNAIGNAAGAVSCAGRQVARPAVTWSPSILAFLGQRRSEFKRTGARTSRIADPPNGRFPPLTPEAQKTAATDREFRLALVQSTDTCKKGLAGCAGWKYDPATSPRRAEAPPRYNTARTGAATQQAE
jgi:hypothetical protein